MLRKILLSSGFCVALMACESIGRAESPSSEAPPLITSSSHEHESIEKLAIEYDKLQEEISNAGQSRSETSPVLKSLRYQLQLVENRMRDIAKQSEADAYDERRNATTEIEDLRGQLRQLTHRTEVSAESLHATARSLEEQRETLMLESAGVESKRAAMAMAIDARTEKAQSQLKDDAVALQLRKLLADREKAFQRLRDMNKAGVATQQEVDAQEAALAEIQLRLVQRETDVAGNAGTDASSSLNEQMVNLTVAQKERQAKLDFISKRLEELSRALDSADRLQELTDEAVRAQQRAEIARRDRRWVESEIDRAKAATSPPTTAP